MKIFPRFPYYSHPPSEAGIDAAAREVHLDPEVRRTVVEVLREQNRAFGADAVQREKNIDRLAAGAVAIVTGQQVGLFSGPPTRCTKHLRYRSPRELTKRGTEAVPVFWLATEDHDLAEINHSFWNTRAGLARYELPSREEDAAKRVGK